MNTLHLSAARATQRRKRRRVAGVTGKYLLFVGPAALLYVPLVLKPLVETFWLSLFAWNGVAAQRQFVGLANFAHAFGDPVFWRAIGNNVAWVIASIVLPMFFGLVLAVMVAGVRRGQRLYTGIFFAPVVLNLIIVGLAWGVIYNPLIGPIAKAMQAVGLGGFVRGWLGNPLTATPAIIIAGNWTFFGFCTVIFLQGLRTMDHDQLEAATIDGANPVQKFFFVTIPALSSQVTLLVILSVIGSFKVFDIVYVMTGGGPDHASEVVATYMYWQAFVNGDFGYGSALAVLLTVFVAAASMAMIALRERKP